MDHTPASANRKTESAANVRRPMLALTFAMTGIAYLLGSVSNAVLISRFYALPDTR